MKEILAALIAFGLVATPAGAACGLWWLFYGPAKTRLLPIQRQRKSWWTGGEVVFVFGIFFFVPQLVYSILNETGFFARLYSEEQQKARDHLWVFILATPIAFAVWIACLFRLSGTRPSHTGLTTARLGENTLTGFTAFVATTPIIFTVLFAIVPFIPPEPHDMKIAGGQQLWLIEWGLLIFSVMVAAPLLEEFAFRGILLFWMVRATRSGHYVVAGIALVFAAQHTVGEWLAHQYVFLGPLLWIGFLVPFYLYAVKRCDKTEELPYVRWPPLLKAILHARERAFRAENEGTTNTDDETRQPTVMQHHNPPAAIIGSAIFFAAIHGAWPSAVPLFFLGLVLGWLAYRTQSLVGPIVFHSLFNGVSVVMLILAAAYR